MKYDAHPKDQAADLDAFTHHPPHGDQGERYEANRRAALGLVALLRQNCPPSPELEFAVARVREAVAWANAAIACNERPAPGVPPTAPPLDRPAV